MFKKMKDQIKDKAIINHEAKTITFSIDEASLKVKIRNVVKVFGGTYPANYTSNQERLVSELNTVFCNELERIVEAVNNSIKEYC
jgi:predicted SpoU family rRNA methylase